MKCIIVDDDDALRLVIEAMVKQVDGLDLIGSCSNAMQASNLMHNHQVDLLFLDVEMPEMSGMDLIRSMDNGDQPQVILITAKQEYAVEAFHYQVTDYIVKPVSPDRFLKAVARARELHERNVEQSRDQQHLFIKVDGRFVHINLADIRFVEALADYVTIHTDDSKYTILSTMKGLYGKLPEQDFMRVHNSYIVRLDSIEEMEDNYLKVRDRSIPVSRSNKKVLLQRMRTL